MRELANIYAFHGGLCTKIFKDIINISIKHDVTGIIINNPNRRDFPIEVKNFIRDIQKDYGEIKNYYINPETLKSILHQRYKNHDEQLADYLDEFMDNIRMSLM